MVDNQHKKISGYRDLSEDDIFAINQAKEIGNTLGDMIKGLESNITIDKRCLALAKTNLQQGIMWLVRSIAKPEGF